MDLFTSELLISSGDIETVPLPTTLKEGYFLLISLILLTVSCYSKVEILFQENKDFMMFVV